MSGKNDNDAVAIPDATPAAAQPVATPPDASADALGNLGDLDKIDFLLEEIENKIAPLALA